MAVFATARVAAPEQTPVCTVIADPLTPGYRRPVGRSAILVGAISVLVSVPCFWEPRIHSLDLASHVYNAWLADLSSRDAVQGVYVTSVWTNTLFDWILSGLMSALPVSAAERVSVWIAALAFFWSCFAFVSRTVGYPPWSAAPIVAAFTYGFMFRLGFLNFYLATALSLAAMAILWSPTRARVLLSVPLFALAALANVLPVAWALSCVTYLKLMRSLSGRYRCVVTAVCAGLILSAIEVACQLLPNYSNPGRISLVGLLDITAGGQLATYDTRFLAIACLFFMMSLALIATQFPFRQSVLFSPLVHLWVLHLITFTRVPEGVQFPQHTIPVSFIPDRVAFFASIIVLAVLCRFVTGGVAWMLGCLSLAFFGLTYHVDAKAELVARELERSVRSLPAESPVIASFTAMESRIHPLTHSIDRACIGHCFSYGNYEPASRAFRVRVGEASPVATADSLDVFSVETGEFVRRATHPPIYAVCNCLDDPGRLCTRPMQAGDRVCSIDPGPVGWQPR